MKNHSQDSKLSRIDYNKIKFPLIQMSTKASTCDKNADIFKRCASV